MSMMGMGTLSTAAIPDFAAPADINRLFALIAVLADPDASKAVLEQLAAARDQAEAKIDEAVTEICRNAAEGRKHNEQLKLDREEKEQALAVAKTSFDQECAVRLRKLQASEQDAYGVKREAEKLLEEAKAMKADLERKLEAIKAATA
jgi:hypothetical protein